MKFSILFALLLLGGISKATDYYVSTSGSNSNNGTSQTTPWQTLSKVQSVFNNGTIAPGDRVLFKKGDQFTGTLLVSSIWGYSAKSGTATNPITIGTYGTGAKPVFQYPTSSTTQLVDRVTMWFVGVNYYVVDGLNFTELTDTSNDKVSPANCAFGIYLGTYGEATCNNFTIKNIDISLTGMGMALVGDYNIVTNCNMSNFKNLKNTYNGGTDDYGANAITIMGNDNQILNNYISGAWAYSSDFGWNGGACEMYNTCNRNKFMYNTIVDCEGVSEYGGQGSAGHVANDNLIAYNKIINCGSLVWLNMSGPFAMQGSNLQLYNNVIVENSLSRFSGPNVGAGNAHPLAQYPSTRLFGYSGTANAATVFNLKNNVFIQGTGINIINASDAGKTIHQNNIYKLTGGQTNFTLASNEISTTSAILSSITAADPISWNYAPLANGPAINFGQNVGISKDFNGNTVPSIPNAGILQTTGTASTLSVSATSGAIPCNGGTTTVTVTATGGTSPYTGTGTFTVAAGTYSYTVTDGSGASQTASVTVSQPSAIVVTLSNGTITVSGGTTTLTTTATGGTGAYTYKLNSGAYQASGSFTGVAAGTHTITVKDANGCTASKTVTITQSTAGTALAATATTGTISCNGGTTTVNIAATGGTQPYSGTGNYTKAAGTYSFTVSDAAGATKNVSVTVTQPTAITATVTAPNAASSTATITASISVTGGVSPYTYKLNSGAYQASASFTGVTVGTHSITVKDANGCTLVKSFTVSVTTVAPLAVTTTTGWILCNGGTTSATIEATGGVPPYTGTGTFTISAGSQNFTVRDAAGTSVTKTVSVVQPAVISSTVTTGTILSYNASTTVTVSSSGGTGAHTYKLDNGAYQTTASFTGVKAGSHTITIKDARGCTSVKSFTLTQPASGTFTLQLTSKTNQTCYGNNNGQITVNGNAGTLPYTFKKNAGGTYGSSNIFTNLAPGNYTIYGKDANGVVSSVTVNIASSSVSCTARSISEATAPVVKTGLEENNLSVNVLKVVAYPNPSNIEFSLQVQQGTNEKVNVFVTNVNGQKVYENITTSNSTIHFGKNFVSGVYQVTVIQGKQILTTRIVKTL